MSTVSWKRRVARFAGIIGLLVWSGAARAEDAYFEIPLRELKITQGTLPKLETDDSQYAYWGGNSAVRDYLGAYAVLDGPGKIYVTGMDASYGGFELSRTRGSAPSVCIRAAAGADVAGTLYVPDARRTQLHKVRFAAPKNTADPKKRAAFYEAKAQHDQWLADRRLPGAAWFRFQALRARATLSGKSLSEAPVVNPSTPDETRQSEFTETLDVFSGGRALSESLQLNRLMPSTQPGQATVELASLPGISVAEMDWRPFVAKIHPEIDPLASALPSDQHAIFFPSLEALLLTIDEADRDGTPIKQILEERAEDAGTRARYERQLCLPLNSVTRLFGDQMIASLAFTGSDPYLPSGSDVALLFEPKPGKAAALRNQIERLQAAAREADSHCQKVEGSIGETKYTGSVSPHRRVCSYLATLQDRDRHETLVVTNSLFQLKRIVETAAGRSESLAALPEYRFFRDRYRRGGAESGLLVISDKTIRRWCGAKWRIGNSRRTRAAAILSEYQAEYLDDLVHGSVEPHNIHSVWPVADLGTLRATPEGIASSTYGTLEFQTPIAELDFTKVTPAEADTYKRWREGYQRNWSQFFDPIAVQFSIRKDRLFVDVTVMPLITSSRYSDFVEIVSGVELKPAAGDPHPGTLAALAVAINTKSKWLKWANNWVEGPVKVSLMSWLGDSVSIYADPDPFWAELSQAAKARPAATTDQPPEDPVEKFSTANVHRLPVAIAAEVHDSLKLTLFLTGLRAFIEQTAPGLVTWTSQEYHGHPYVKVAPTASGRQSLPVPESFAIYYAATPRLLTLTLNEDLLKRALDRESAADGNARHDTKKEEPPASNSRPADVRPWLGKSVSLQIDRRAIELLEQAFGPRQYQSLMQARAWSNLPILNEWKRRYPDRDPVAVEEQVWHTALVCPGGGKYVWNADYQTMESTVYGHPGQPRFGPDVPAPLADVRWIDFGLTFENHGLRAKAEIHRGRE